MRDNWKIRHNMRLREFDYSLPGAYFLTVCAKNRQQILSTIHEERIILSTIGQICEKQLLLPEERYPIRLERHVIMPNHVHVLLSIYKAEQSPAPIRKAHSHRHLLHADAGGLFLFPVLPRCFSRFSRGSTFRSGWSGRSPRARRSADRRVRISKKFCGSGEPVLRQILIRTVPLQQRFEAAH